MDTALVVFVRRVLDFVWVLVTHLDVWVTHCVHVPEIGSGAARFRELGLYGGAE